MMKYESSNNLGLRDKNLEGSLILCQFSKIVVIDSLLGSLSSPNMDSLEYLQYQQYVSSCGMGLKFK